MGNIFIHFGRHHDRKNDYIRIRHGHPDRVDPGGTDTDIIEGHPAPAVDMEKAVLDCLRHPTGTAPLAELVQPGDKVCFVCADITRAWNLSISF